MFVIPSPSQCQMVAKALHIQTSPYGTISVILFAPWVGSMLKGANQSFLTNGATGGVPSHEPRLYSRYQRRNAHAGTAPKLQKKAKRSSPSYVFRTPLLE
jgi:hypothetical protein